MDACANDGRALSGGAQGSRHERPDRGKDDGRIERFGGRGIGGAGPDRAQVPGELLRCRVTRTGESVERMPVGNGELSEDMGSGAEAIEPQPGRPGFGQVRHAVGAIADQPGTKQWRSGDIVIAIGDRETVLRVGNGHFCVTAIAGIAGEGRRVAQVFAVVEAIRAMPAGLPQPWYTDAFANRETGDVGPEPFDPADDLMTGHQGQSGIGKFAVDHVQICAAHPAGGHTDQDFILRRLGHRQVGQFERRANFCEDHGAHGEISRGLTTMSV